MLSLFGELVVACHDQQSISRLALAATHTARLINISDLAVPFQLSRQTIHDYMGDTGLACALMGIDAATLPALLLGATHLTLSGPPSGVASTSPLMRVATMALVTARFE